MERTCGKCYKTYAGRQSLWNHRKICDDKKKSSYLTQSTSTHDASTQTDLSSPDKAKPANRERIQLPDDVVNNYSISDETDESSNDNHTPIIDSDINVCGVQIPIDRDLTNFQLSDYVEKLQIPNFRGVFMRDTLPNNPKQVECGIVNLNRSNENGSHWVCYVKVKKNRIYFDSLGQDVPIEISRYLKTVKEFNEESAVIARNTDTFLTDNTHVCGHLCLVVLTALMRVQLSYQQLIDSLNGR